MDWRMSCRGALAVLALSLFGAPAGAQDIPGQPSINAGAELAAKVCSNCHLTGAPNQKRAKADVPTFREIANQENQTPDEIVLKMILPKHPMPQIQLTRDERAHLAAYIMSQRSSDVRPQP